MNPSNDYAAFALDRAVNGTPGAFYILTGSPRAQAAAVAGYDGLAVFDYAKDEERRLVEIARLMDAQPTARACVFLNFQLALWDREAETWDRDAVRRLNYSRDALARRGRTLIFCMTAEADTVLNRNAFDFYDYVKLFFHFEDPPEERERVEAARPVDRSTGVDVKVDFTLPDEELLALAISIGNQAWELLEKEARYADALYLYGKQREIREHVLGMENVDTAETYNSIGVVYHNMGEYAISLKWYQESLDIKEKSLGNDNYSITETYCNIGVVYNRMGEYDEALKWLQKALVIREEQYGSTHPYTALIYNEIGVVYNRIRKYTTALQWYKKALDIYEQSLGETHLDTATIYHNIGVVYYRMDEYLTALKWYHKALNSKEKALGTEHPSTASTYNNIGSVYVKIGDYKTAIEWFRKAFKIRLATLGSEHPDTARTSENIGWAKYHMGEYNIALKLQLKAVSILETYIGYNHLDTIEAYNEIADTYAAMGDPAMEQVYRAKAAEAQRKRHDQGET